MVSITDFRGGYNDTKYSLNIADNEFSEFSNVDPLKNGGFKIRNGTKNVNNEAFPGKVTQIIEWKLKDGTTKTIVISGRKMYVLSSVFGSYKCVKYNNEELTLNRDTVSYVFFKDNFYFTDGKTMYKWSDGTYYLHNLSMTEPYSFKRGDIIKITATEKETGFGSANLSDVRQPFSKKISYVIRYEKDSFNKTETYDYQEFDIQASIYNEDDNGLYSLQTKEVSYTQELTGSFTTEYIEIDGYDYSYIKIFIGNKNEIVPTHKISSGIHDLKTFDIRVQYIYIASSGIVQSEKFTAVKLSPDYVKKATVNDYYIFENDVDNFYPHNYNYETNKRFYGNSASLKKIENIEEYEFNIQTVEVPFDIMSCEYFSYHPQSFRFFASGNPYDPCACYYSGLNDFESWETATDEDTVVNVIYPRYNYGPVTGLIATGNYMLTCYKNGFSSVIGYNPDEYVFANLSVPVGVASTKTLCIIPSGLVFFADNSIYLMSNSLIGTDYVKIPSQSELVNISKNKCENILKDSSNHVGKYFDNKYYLYFLDKNSTPKILVYDFDLGSFSLYEDIEANCLMVKENNSLYGGNGKYVLDMFSDGVSTDFYDEIYRPIKFCVKSKLFDFSQNYGRFKLEKIYITTNYVDYSLSNDKTNIYLTLKNEYKEEKSETNTRFEGGNLWTNSLQNSLWTCNDEYVSYLLDTNILFHRISFCLDNKEKCNLKEPFVVYSISFEFSECQKALPMYKNDVRKINKDINLNYERR